MDSRFSSKVRGILVLGLAWLAVGPSLADEPASGKIVAEIVPQNNRIHSNERILSQMQTKVGKPYSDIIAQEDARRLMSTKWFLNVDISTRSIDDKRVAVLVTVYELPNTIQEIVYRGAYHISLEDLDTLTGLRKGTPLSPIANQNAAQAILRKYHEMGRMFATVELVEGNKTSDTRVVFHITEGPEVKISSISFVGNHFISSDRLKTQITSSRAWFNRIGGIYNAAQVEHDMGKLLEYYRSLGFHSVRVSRELVWAPDLRTLKLVFHIDEGPRYQIGRIQIEGNRVFSEEKLLSMTQAKTNRFYNRAEIQGDLARIKDFYGRTGRNVAVQEKVYAVDGDPGVVNVVYEVMEREPARVGEIKIIGNEVTQDRVIRRNVPLYPGQILSYPAIQEAEANLARTGIFKTDPAEDIRPRVEVLDPDSDSPFKDILIRVQEQPTGSFLLGIGVNSDAGLSGSIVLNERNFDLFAVPRSLDDILAGRAFRGAGQEFRLEAVPGTVFQRYTASWRDPALFDGPFSLALSGYYFQRAFPEYHEDRVGGRATVGTRLNQFWSANASVRVEGVDVYNIPFGAPFDITRDAGQTFLVGLRAGLQRDTRDSFLRPTEGSLIDIGYEQVLGTYDYPLAILEASKFWTIHQRADGSGRHVLAARTQLSIAGANAPVYERFYAGGFRSLRGFEFRGVGPFVNGFNVGGEFAFLNTIEYQIPILANDQVYFVGFCDSGTSESSLKITDYRVTAGLGLRLVVPMMGPVPIALDFGFPIVRGPEDRTRVFSFWIGFFN